MGRRIKKGEFLVQATLYVASECIHYARRGRSDVKYDANAGVGRSDVESRKYGDPGWILTTDLPLRRRTLYTAELRDRRRLDFEMRAAECQEIPRPAKLRLGIVRDQRLDVVARKLGAAIEEREFDNEEQR